MDPFSPSSFGPAQPPAQPAASPRVRVLREWLLLALVWVGAAALAAFSLVRARDAAVLAELDRLGSQAQAMEQQLLRQLEGVGAALTGVRGLVRQNPHGPWPALPAQLDLLAGATAGVDRIVVLNAQGRVVGAAQPALLGTEGTDADHLRHARENAAQDQLLVSRPLSSQLGPQVVMLARALPDAGGGLGALVAATLDQDYFGLVLQSVLYAPDVVATVSHGDGIVIVRAGAGRQIVPPGSMLRRHLDSGQPESRQQGPFAASGEPRMVALRTITPARLRMDVPLVVGISRSQAAVLAPWHEQVQGIALGMAFAGATGSLWLGLHQRRRRIATQAARQAAQAERDAARRLAVALEGADLGLWEWDLRDDTVRASPREFELMGYPPQTAPLLPAFWRSLLHPDDRERIADAVREHLRGHTRGYRQEHRMRHSDGHWLWVLDNARVLQYDAHGRALRVVGTHLDISERMRSQLELERMNGQLEALSLTDSLTGVANRRQFDLALASEWKRAQRTRQPLALLMIDVDHFKRYNDALGHPQGDVCLRALAQALSACLRHPQETLARYGGEEFAVLVAGDLQSGATVAHRCLDTLAQARLPHPDSPIAPYVTVSIGVSSYEAGDGAASPEQLVRDADAALYQAKKGGRARYVLAGAPSPTSPVPPMPAAGPVAAPGAT